jgi:hypothetical protein
MVTLKGATGAKVNRSVSSASISSTNNTKDGKDKKKYSDEIERYHEINEAIEDQERELDRLSKAKDRAWGPQRLAYMEAEKKAMEEDLEL